MSQEDTQYFQYLDSYKLAAGSTVLPLPINPYLLSTSLRFSVYSYSRTVLRLAPRMGPPLDLSSNEKASNHLVCYNAM